MIKVKDLTLKVGNKTILNRSSFDISGGDKILLMGESGCGKSVLLSTLLGFYPFESGTITIGGLELNSQNRLDIRRRIGYFAQNPFLPSGKLRDVISRIFTLKFNDPLNLDWQKLIGILQYLHLDESILNSSFELLSGGEKQRVYFAVMLMLKRDIIFMDEPTSALDSHLKESVINYLKKIDATMIIVSHDKEWINSEAYKKKELEWVQKR